MIIQIVNRLGLQLKLLSLDGQHPAHWMSPHDVHYLMVEHKLSELLVDMPMELQFFMNLMIFDDDRVDGLIENVLQKVRMVSIRDKESIQSDGFEIGLIAQVLSSYSCLQC